jgi:dTDP-4-amino-4,6-dideoxygalactose transaminase
MVLMRIRMVDLSAQNREVRNAVAAEFSFIHERAAYIGGPQVTAFEKDFAQFLGVRKVVAVGSGTDAIRLALQAAGVGPGEAVVTTPLTFIATVEAIVQLGARPIFADVEPATGNLSAEEVDNVLKTTRIRGRCPIRAIVAVHLYGLPAALGALSELAQRHSLALIEDACQAHGARLRYAGRWLRAGTVGVAGCFSFYPGKNLGAWGDGGAIATNDETLAAHVTKLRDHGRVSHYQRTACGYNSRLDTLQAAVLAAKLKRLDAWNRKRRQVAQWYRAMLAECNVQPLVEPEDRESCYHQFVIRSRKRDQIREALLGERIECAIHYPIALHLQPACRFLGYRARDFPVAEELAATVLSLPMHPHLTEEEVAEVSRVVRAVANGR